MANSMATSMTNPIAGDIHKATTWSIVLSVLMIAAGVLAIFSPAIAGVAVTVFFGWLLIFSGILHLAYAWQAGRPGAVVWEILLGILYGGIGFYLLAQPGAGLASLTLALAFYLVFEGVLESVRRRQHVLQRHHAANGLGRRAPDRGVPAEDGIAVVLLT